VLALEEKTCGVFLIAQQQRLWGKGRIKTQNKEKKESLPRGYILQTTGQKKEARREI